MRLGARRQRPLAALWFHHDGLRAGVGFALGALLALGIGALLGALWVEQRPLVADHFAPVIIHGEDVSFPSDHLLVLGALTGACWMRARPLGLVALGLAILVAVGRVFVGVHYPIDVVAGFGIGAGCGVVGWFACRAALALLERLDGELRRRRVRPVLLGEAGSKRAAGRHRGDRAVTDVELPAGHAPYAGRTPLVGRWWFASLVPLLCLPVVEVSAYRRLVVVLVVCAAMPAVFARHRHRVWVGRLCWGVAVMMTISGVIFAPVRQSRPSFWFTLALLTVVVGGVAAFFGDGRLSVA